MSQPKKQVRTLHERLKIVEEVEKNPGDRRVNIAKRLGLAPSTLTPYLQRRTKSESRQKNVTPVRRGKRTESTFTELESVLFTWYQQARASNIPVDGTILRGKARMIAAQLNIENVTVSNCWIARFKDWHGLVYKKLAGESAAVDSESREAWLERLPSLLEGYKQHDI
jgi:hypothetical protein